MGDWRTAASMRSARSQRERAAAGDAGRAPSAERRVPMPMPMPGDRCDRRPSGDDTGRRLGGPACPRRRWRGRRGAPRRRGRRPGRSAGGTTGRHRLRPRRVPRTGPVFPGGSPGRLKASDRPLWGALSKWRPRRSGADSSRCRSHADSGLNASSFNASSSQRPFGIRRVARKVPGVAVSVVPSGKTTRAVVAGGTSTVSVSSSPVVRHSTAIVPCGDS